MKKTYVLTHPKLNLARIIEAAKHDAKKYIKREERKPLPAGDDFWGFDCKFGPTEDDTKDIHVSEINKCMVEAESNHLPSFYLEIWAKGMQRTKRPIAENDGENLFEEDED